MKWLMRKGTRAAQKVPTNSIELCTLAHGCLTVAVRLENIPAGLIVNADQAGVCLIPTGDTTYEEKGSKQVTVNGNDEKHQVSWNLIDSLNLITNFIFNL
jgi:hypothetical protein